MPGSEIPDLQGVFRFVSRLHTMSKRGMRGALADCPRCHFGMLENLHILIEQRGAEGADLCFRGGPCYAAAYAGHFPWAAHDGAGWQHRAGN